MSNVNFLTGVFHPQYTFDTTNGVQMRLDTSLDGNVTIGDLTTSYAFLVNGLPVGSGGDVSRWADYPAKNNVDLSGYSITSSTGGITLSGSVYALGNIAIPSGNIVLASGNIAVGGDLLVEATSRFGGTVNIGDPSTNYALNLNGVSVVKPHGSANLNTLTYAQIASTGLYTANISMTGVLATSQIQASLAVNPAPITPSDATAAAACRIVCTVPRVNSADIVFSANPLSLSVGNVLVQWNVVSF